ncbi:glycerophosphodiester phosphodiesterase [Rossellomorea sp. AcN35-11]|nr:glycerophosphodiester phosphodiesterase [Rossellomorea aquimaris]WJV31617.1 glycerophosphodiester phosphodiesterase [Rossellomorea sp. AcN35-11]
MKILVNSVILSSAIIGMAAVSFHPSFASHPEMNGHEFLTIAHRGASAYAPEHTLSSYDRGNDMGGDYLEIDLQMTKDGELIAMHDKTLDRTTDGSGLVKNYTLKELKELDAGSWFNEMYPEMASSEFTGLKVQTLGEILHHFGQDKRFYIETKSPEVYPGMEEKLLKILKDHNLLGQNVSSSKVIIQSFSDESLKKIHGLNDDIPLVQLIDYQNEATITDKELEDYEEYAVGLGMDYKKIDEEYVDKVRDHGLFIHPYTVLEKKDMKRLIEWGVTGMFTNYPDRLEEVVKEMKTSN